MTRGVLIKSPGVGVGFYGYRYALHLSCVRSHLNNNLPLLIHPTSPLVQHLCPRGEVPAFMIAASGEEKPADHILVYRHTAPSALTFSTRRLSHTPPDAGSGSYLGLRSPTWSSWEATGRLIRSQDIWRAGMRGHTCVSGTYHVLMRMTRDSAICRPASHITHQYITVSHITHTLG